LCINDSPQTYAAALVKLGEYRDSVRNAFAAGTPVACDSALHEVGRVLTALPKLAEQEGMSDENVAQVKTAVSVLRTQFDKIHESFHGQGKGASYDDVAGEMETAISGLVEAVNL
jgi:hypothetical protein